jgi:hypothetical protein
MKCLERQIWPFRSRKSILFFRIDWPNWVLVTRSIQFDASRGKSKRTTQEWEMKEQEGCCLI